MVLSSYGMSMHKLDVGIAGYLYDEKKYFICILGILYVEG